MTDYDNPWLYEDKPFTSDDIGDYIGFVYVKGELGYLEAKEQFDRNVLLSEEYYNGIINCKIHRSHVQGLK
jgi:hypothetical protein